MPITQKCAICFKPYQIKACHEGIIICCSAECRKEKRKQNALLRQKTDPSFAPPTVGSDKAKKIGQRVKQAYQDGRMNHMKEIWKVGEKKWTGRGNPRYRHGNANGYKMIKRDGIWIPEHRAIIEKELGRNLKEGEVVHHINGNKKDNSRENLIVMTVSAHISHHRNNK